MERTKTTKIILYGLIIILVSCGIIVGYINYMGKNDPKEQSGGSFEHSSDDEMDMGFYYRIKEEFRSFKDPAVYYANFSLLINMLSRGGIAIISIKEDGQDKLMLFKPKEFAEIERLNPFIGSIRLKNLNNLDIYPYIVSNDIDKDNTFFSKDKIDFLTKIHNIKIHETDSQHKDLKDFLDRFCIFGQKFKESGFLVYCYIDSEYITCRFLQKNHEDDVWTVNSGLKYPIHEGLHAKKLLTFTICHFLHPNLIKENV